MPEDNVTLNSVVEVCLEYNVVEVNPSDQDSGSLFGYSLIFIEGVRVLNLSVYVLWQNLNSN